MQFLRSSMELYKYREFNNLFIAFCFLVKTLNSFFLNVGVLQLDFSTYDPDYIQPRQLMADPMGDDTQAPMLLGISGSILLISILLLYARLWSRVGPISNLGLDDWTVFVATVRQPLLHRVQ